jgi:hypothetical protein
MSLALIIGIIVIAIVILAMINLFGKANPKGVDKVYFKNEWNDVISLSHDAKTRPLSIVHADKLLDEGLKCCGFGGENMGQRLISAKYRLKAKDAVWSAHRLRNKIVHEPLIEPSEREVNTALRGYYKAFKDLGVF